MGDNVEVRRVQQVGSSTLTVSVPREWAKEVGLKQGDVVSLRREDDGTLRLTPGMPKQEVQSVRCVVDADKCTQAGLLARIITGLYIIGHDSIQIVSKKELSPEHLDEIRRTTQRLTGINVVEQTFNQVLMQSFVDPTRFPVAGLLRRLYIITSSMLKAGARALKEGRVTLAQEVIHMEDEVDRIYWLVVRQLLLAAQNKEVGKKIGIESNMNIAGNRVIAKSLEKIGDFAESMAKEVVSILKGLKVDERIIDSLVEFSKLVQNIYDTAVKALFALDIKLANEAIEAVEKAEVWERRLTEEFVAKPIIASQEELKLEFASDEVKSHISTAADLRAVAWNIGQIARYCSTIAEVSMNRALETSTELCKYEKQA